MHKYSINIVWSDEDGGYIATVPEFNNLSAFGETYEKALKEAKVAINAYIEAHKSEKIPLPDFRKVSNYSGQIRLRMPKDLHYKLTAESEKQGVSLNHFMVYLLTMNYNIHNVLASKPVTQKYLVVLNATESKDERSDFALGSDSVRRDFSDINCINCDQNEGGRAKW